MKTLMLCLAFLPIHLMGQVELSDEEKKIISDIIITDFEQDARADYDYRFSSTSTKINRDQLNLSPLRKVEQFTEWDLFEYHYVRSYRTYYLNEDQDLVRRENEKDTSDYMVFNYDSAGDLQSIASHKDGKSRLDEKDERMEALYFKNPEKDRSVLRVDERSKAYSKYEYEGGRLKSKLNGTNVELLDTIIYATYEYDEHGFLMKKVFVNNKTQSQGTTNYLYRFDDFFQDRPELHVYRETNGVSRYQTSYYFDKYLNWFLKEDRRSPRVIDKTYRREIKYKPKSKESNRED